MIDVKSLMIGNWVNWDIPNKPIKIESIIKYEERKSIQYEINPDWQDEYTYQGIDIEDFSAIPLTPEILEKCGFFCSRKSNRFWTIWILPNNWHILQSHHNEPSVGVKEDCFYWGEEYIEIKSLHHLQNFYSCHTGKHLEINLK